MLCALELSTNEIFMINGRHQLIVLLYLFKLLTYPFFSSHFFLRYFAICRPLEYPLYMTKKTVYLMIANVWFLPSIISFIPIFFGWYTTEDQLRWNEKHPSDCVFVVNKVYAVVSSSISFWIPGIVMITMYYRIFKWVNIDSMLFQLLQLLRIFVLLSWIEYADASKLHIYQL